MGGKKRFHHQKRQVNTVKGKSELSQMIADTLAHYAFKRELRKAQHAA